MPADTSIPCSTDTRDRVRALKRGGESYDELLSKLVDAYDPQVDDRQELAAD